MRTDGFLLDSGEILLVNLKVHGDSCRLDGDTSLFLVISRIGETHVTGFRTSDDSSF